MAKKPSTKKSLKSLFSRSDANPKQPKEEKEEKEEKSNGGEKKKFKLFKFSLKSKSNTALEKTADARSSERIFSDGEDVSLDSHSKSSLSATAPRSKGKGLSFSELDLAKVKKSGAFSFTLRKKKRAKDRDELSKSVIGLHSPWTAACDDERLDAGGWEPTLAARQGAALAMSQPELDTAEAFDIPAPPPPLLASQRLASQRSSSEAFLSRQDPPTLRYPPTLGDHRTLGDPPTLHDRHGRLRSLETLLDSPEAFDVDREMGTAPLATMPELQLTAPSSPDQGQRRQQHDAGAGKSEAPPLQNPSAGPPEAVAVPGVDGPPGVPGGAPADVRTAVDSPLSFSRPSNYVLSPVVFVQKNTMNPYLPAADLAASPPGDPVLAAQTSVDGGAAMAIPTPVDPVNASSPLSQGDSSVHPFQELSGEPGASGGSSDDSGSPSGDGGPRSGSEDAYQSVFSQSFTTEVFSAMQRTSDPPAPDRVAGQDPRRRQQQQQPSPPPARHPVHADHTGFPEDPAGPGVSEHGPAGVDAAPDVVLSAPDPADGAQRGERPPLTETPRTEMERAGHPVLCTPGTLHPLSLHRTAPTLPGADPHPRAGEGPGRSHGVTTTTTTPPAVRRAGEPAGPDPPPGPARVVALPGGVSYSAVKPEEPGPRGNTEAPVSLAGRPAPPPPRNYPERSPETADTHTQPRLVLEGAGSLAVRDDVVSASLRPSPPLETMAASEEPQETFETMTEGEEEEEAAVAAAAEEEQESFAAPRGPRDACGGGSGGEPTYFSVGSDGSSAMDVYFSADEEDGGSGGDPDDASTLAGSDGDPCYRDAREDQFGFETPDLGGPAGGGAEGEAVRLNDRSETEGRRLGSSTVGQRQDTGRAESPPALPAYSPPPPLPPPPEGGQRGREATGGAESWKRRIDMWGERLDKHVEVGVEEEEEEEEEQQQQQQQQCPALPVQQVETVMECEPVPPFSQARSEGGEEVGEEVGDTLEQLTLLVTREQPAVSTPDPQGTQGGPHKGFRAAETDAQHRRRDAHTSPDLIAGLATTTAGGVLDLVERRETGEVGEDAVSPTVWSLERSAPHGDPVDPAAGDSRVTLDLSAPVTVSLQATTSSSSYVTTTTTTTTSSFSDTSFSDTASFSSRGGAKPPEASERVRAEEISDRTQSSAAARVLPEQTAGSQADEASPEPGPRAPAQLHHRPIQPQGSPATGPAPGPQDLHLSTTSSGSPLVADPHPGPPPLAPPPVAEMSYEYGALYHTARRGSPPREDGGRGDRLADLGSRYTLQETTSTSTTSSSTSGAPEVQPTGGDRTAHPWRNSFDGVSQYKQPYSTSTSSLDSSAPSSSYYRPEASLDTGYRPASDPASASTSASTSTPMQTYDPIASGRREGRRVVYVSTRSVSTEADDDVDAAVAAAAAAGGGGGAVGGSQRRSWEREEPGAAPVREPEARTEQIEVSRDAARLPVERLSSSLECTPGVASHDSTRLAQEDAGASAAFTGVFKATRVDLITEPTLSSPAVTPAVTPASPDSPDPAAYHDMEVLKDTLKSMGPGPGVQKQRSLRGAPFGFSSLPPIVEDTSSPTGTIAAAAAAAASPTASSSSFDATDSFVPLAPEGLAGPFSLPPGLGLGLGGGSPLSPRSPLDLMKQSQQDPLLQNGSWGLGRPLRASASSSIVLRSSSEDPASLAAHNGNNGLPQIPGSGSRLDHSVLFASYRSSSVDTPPDAGPLAPRSLFRASSLPDSVGSVYDRMSKAPRQNGGAAAADATPSAYDRFSFLLNSNPSSTPSAGSLTGAEDLYSRMSRGPGLNGTAGAAGASQRLLSPTLDFGRTPTSFSATATDLPFSAYSQTHGPAGGMGPGAGVLGAPLLQRSFSSEAAAGAGGQLLHQQQHQQHHQQHSPLLHQQHQQQQQHQQHQQHHQQHQQQPSPLFLNSTHGGGHPKAPEPAEPERPLATKYRAFPDAYLTKEKEHGKLNPRPGKIFIFDRPGMCGQRIEVRSDVVDATGWELQETISIRVVRGGWVLYEKPNFKGEKVALDEGDLELTFPFLCPEEEEVPAEPQGSIKQNGAEAGGEQNGGQNGVPAEKPKPARKFIIGSLRRTVRDYSVPEISLFPEENAEGKKVTFRDTCEDARIFGFPVKANSIIINAGLWLVYAEPFFQGVPRVLEVGGFTNPAAWGVEQPYVGSLHPLKIGEPRAENMDEPQMILFDKPYFSGKSRTIYSTMKNFMTRTDNQTVLMHSVGSIKVQGGIWVGFEKEGFRGHQYLLEEGDYQDWRVWGGCNAELRSVKVIRADLSEPMLMMFEQPEDEDLDEENSFEVTEAIPDVEIFQYKTTTRSINVLSGAWVAYSHVDFSGKQYILEKGFYHNCADWGAEDNIICSVQPILPAPNEDSKARNEILLYTESGFQGKTETFKVNQLDVSDKIVAKSCRLLGGSWVLYDAKDYTGNQCVLSEGEYPNLLSMGCPASFAIRSLKAVPLIFSIPSISLFSLECLEGKEVTTELEMCDLMAEGFNNHFLSVRVNSGCWVLCEYSNYRGRQFLLEPIEITNWPMFSSLQTIGSMYPVRQRRRFFRVKNKEHRSFLCVHGGLEDMKAGRVVVSADPEPGSDIWFYDDGFLKNKMSTCMSLQVMGTVEPGSKVVLWTDSRQPLQTWTVPMRGRISSPTFPGMVLEVKGGKSYDKDFVVIQPENEESPNQPWELELL